MHGPSLLVAVGVLVTLAGCASAAPLATPPSPAVAAPPQRFVLTYGQAPQCDCAQVADGAKVLGCYEISLGSYEKSAEARRVLRLTWGMTTNIIACVLQ